MSLIKCIECGKEISDKSEICVNCGCPTSESTKKFEQLKQPDKIFYKCPLCKKIFENGTFECDVCGYQSVIIQDTKQQPIQQNIPKCPHCNSTNLTKISTLKKATKIGMFGIFGAGDIGKTYKCNTCGSRF